MTSVPSTFPSTVTISDHTDGESSDVSGAKLTDSAGVAYVSDYGVHELPSEESCLDMSGCCDFDEGADHTSETQVLVKTALVTWIEALETATLSEKTFVFLAGKLLPILTWLCFTPVFSIMTYCYGYLGPSICSLNVLGV